MTQPQTHKHTHPQTHKHTYTLVHINTGKEMRRAAFKVFASLGANDEDIRKKIIDTEPLMEAVVTALEDPDPRVQMAAIRCLHSLSRSVQLLRTTFQVLTPGRSGPD